MSKEISKQLAKCPFCDNPLKLIGSKQRGNQHYLHEYNSNCILNGFGFIATNENVEHWNTRKPLARIVERLEEEEKFHNSKSYEDDFVAQGVMAAIEIVREEGGMNV